MAVSFSGITTIIIVACISFLQVPVTSILQCYSCTSAQSGCGGAIDVKLQRWKFCDEIRGTPNYCVKLVEKVADQTTITRGCLSDLLRNTQYRFNMPQVRRQGYCSNAKDFQSYLMGHLKGLTLAESVMGIFGEQHGDYKRYCFCNDWNGCNRATRSLYESSKWSLLATSVISTQIWRLLASSSFLEVL